VRAPLLGCIKASSRRIPPQAAVLSFHFLLAKGNSTEGLSIHCDTSPAARRPNEVSPPLSDIPPLPPPFGARGRNEVPFARRR
jgi:hypothetical protein